MKVFSRLNDVLCTYNRWLCSAGGEVCWDLTPDSSYHHLISIPRCLSDTTLGKHRCMHFRLVKPGQVLPQTIHTQTMSGWEHEEKIASCKLFEHQNTIVLMPHINHQFFSPVNLTLTLTLTLWVMFSGTDGRLVNLGLPAWGLLPYGKGRAEPVFQGC